MWREPARRVTLYQALIRPAMMDLIVDKGTELGITRLVPLLTEHVERGGAKIDRWRRVAEESAKQCGRGWIPEISATMEWNTFIKQKMINPLIVAHDKTEQSLLKVIHDGMVIPASGDIAAIVGPEGGLTSHELEDLRKLGSIEVNLGVRRLRSETSALAILAQLSDC
jgi:16S rRNA (uracil1498-N3)-methyltransferase